MGGRQRRACRSAISVGRALGEFRWRDGKHQPYAITWAEEAAVFAERRVRLFRNGRNQTLRIPRGFELPGKDAVLRKEGERLIVEPVAPKSLLSVLATLSPLDESLAEVPDPLPRAVEL